MVINGICTCHLREYRERGIEWPKKFVAVPGKGSKVMSLDGNYVLFVRNIIHRIEPFSHKPGIIVELVTRPMRDLADERSRDKSERPRDKRSKNKS